MPGGGHKKTCGGVTAKCARIRRLSAVHVTVNVEPAIESTQMSKWISSGFAADRTEIKESDWRATVRGHSSTNWATHALLRALMETLTIDVDRHLA